MTTRLICIPLPSRASSALPRTHSPTHPSTIPGPETLAIACLPAPTAGSRLNQERQRAGLQRPPWRGVVGGAPRDPGGGRGMTAARAPAGRGGPERPGRAAAERAGPALQKAAAGSPGRSHPAAGADGGSRTAWRPGSQDTPATPLPTPALGGPGCAASPSSGLVKGAAPQPRAGACAASAPCPPLGPALARLAGPAPGWGRGQRQSGAMGRPLGTEQPPEA